MKRAMSASSGVPVISRQKLDSLRSTSQSQPGRSQPWIIKNITNGRTCSSALRRTGSGSLAHACGIGQHRKNVRAPCT